MLNEKSMEIRTDKCTECWSMKIPYITKVKVDRLSAAQRTKMKEDLLIVMAEHLHKNDFDPNKYLNSDD